MSVLLVACMIAGMVFNTKATPVYADESGGTVTTNSGSNTNNPTTDGQEGEPTVAANDISQLQKIPLFKTETDVSLGSELSFAGINAHVLSIEPLDGKFHVSLAIKDDDTTGKTWDEAKAIAEGSSYKEGIYTPNAEAGAYVPDEGTASDDIKFYNATNQMLSVKDVQDAGEDLKAALDAPYWLGSEVVGTKEYSVAAYVNSEGEVDIAGKETTINNIYVKTNTEKVKYIYYNDGSIDDLNYDITTYAGWVDNASWSKMHESNSSTTGKYGALYYAADATEGANGLALTKLTGTTPEEAGDEKYHLVAKTNVTATCPSDADKVLIAVLNEQSEVVYYKTVSTQSSTEVTTDIPDIVGNGSLKMVAFSSTDGAIKGEVEYPVEISAQEPVSIKLKDADAEGKLNLTLDFKDVEETAQTTATANIALTVKESNYQKNPKDKGDFVLSTVKTTEEITTDSTVTENEVTSVTVSGYDKETGNLTVTSDTTFSEDNMKQYAKEKDVYLYYCLDDSNKLLIGNVNIIRQYTEEFAYDNTTSTYSYGEISNEISNETYVNNGLAMTLTEGTETGVEKFLKSVPDGSTTQSAITIDELLYLSRKSEEGGTTQFNYKKDANSETTTRVNECLNVGTYTTTSKDVAARVCSTDEGLTFTECDDVKAESASNEVFRFVLHNNGERQFSITAREITLKTNEQSINSGQKLSSDANVSIEITSGVEEYTLTYGDKLQVNLTTDENKNIIFSNLENSDKKYKIVRGEEDVTDNYSVTLSNTYGKLITTSLSAKLYADGSETELTATEGSEPPKYEYTVTYDGQKHKVVAKAGTITDEENAAFKEFDENSAVKPTIQYKYKQINPSEADAKTADYGEPSTDAPEFTEAGEYLVEYTVSLEAAGYVDYTGHYYVNITKQPVTVTIANQTYPYTNVAGKTYFKQFDTENTANNDKLVSAEGLLAGHSITAITLVPEELADGALTGSGKITAEVSSVAIKAGDVDKTENYDITIADGTFTIESPTITVTIADVSGEYKGSAYSITPTIGATYGNGETSETVEIDETQVKVYYAEGDSSDFTTELPDLTSAGERTIKYYAQADGYKSSNDGIETSSFTINITKKDLEIMLADQEITYPKELVKEFSTSDENVASYATVTGLVKGHVASGTIEATKSEEPLADGVYEAGTLSVAKTSEDTFNVQVLVGDEDVTANYNIITAASTYTISKNTIKDEQVNVVSYSGTYDSASHNAVTIEPVDNAFDSTTDKIYYCLFNKGEFDENSLTSIKNTSENEGDKVWSEAVPQIQAAGEYVVAYKIVKTGYSDYIKSTPAVIEKANLTLYVAAQDGNINDLILKTEDADEITKCVSPIGLAGEDKITSVELYSPELANSTDGTVTNGTIDVKQTDDVYAVVVKNGDSDVTSNYNITSVGNSLTVKKATFTVTAEVPEAGIEYDAQKHSVLEFLTINGKPAKEAIEAVAGTNNAITVECSTDGITYVSADDEKVTLVKPGTLQLYYKVTARGYNAYESDLPITLKVNKKALGITIPSQEHAYGNGAFDENGYTIDETNLIEGHKLNKDSFKLAVEPFTNNATGTVDIKTSGNIVITDSNNNDSDVTDCYELKSTSTEAATYTVTESTIADDKYSITVDDVAATLEGNVITGDYKYKAATYNVAVKENTTDGSLKDWKVTYRTKENGAAEYGASTDSLALLNAGTYNVEATISATGYANKVVEFTFTITKQTIEITLASQTITYGDEITQPEAGKKYGNVTVADTVFTSIAGIQGGDTITVGNIAVVDGTDGAKLLQLAESDVTVNYANADAKDNYEITVNEDATLTVDKRSVTITVENQSITDGKEPVLSVNQENAGDYISASLCDGDYIESATITKVDEATGTSGYTTQYTLNLDATALTIKNQNGDDVTDKYNITPASGTLSIESMPVEIEGETVVYDGKAHVGKVTVADGYSFDWANATIECEGVTDVTGADGQQVNVTVKADGYKDKTGTATVVVTAKSLNIKALDQENVNLNGTILQVGGTTSDGKTAVAILRGATAGENEIAVAQITGLVEGQSVEGIKLVADTTSIGSKDITVSTDGLKIMSGEEEVTGNYDISTASGLVYVNPETITISRDGTELVDNITNVPWTYNGESPLGTITANPDDATLEITVDGEKVENLSAAASQTISAGTHTVIIKATKTNYANAQKTIIFTVDKAEGTLAAEPAGLMAVKGDTSEIVEGKYAIQVPPTGTSYGLAVNVTLDGQPVNKADYKIEYATEENGTYEESLSYNTAGEYTIWYKVTIETDNFANMAKGETITGSKTITICDHANATFTKKGNNIYTCDICGATVRYVNYQVGGGVATVIDSENTSTPEISILDITSLDEENPTISLGPNQTTTLDVTSYKKNTNVFMGWYLESALESDGTNYSLASATPVSTSLTWECKAELNKGGQTEQYIAVFKNNKTYQLTAEANEGEGSVTVMVDGEATASKVEVALGSEVTVTATPNEGYKFAYWTNESGLVLSESAEYTFSLTGETAVKAVFTEAGKVTVNTYNMYGQSINTQSFEVGTTPDNVEIVDAPAVLDYVFIGWKLEVVKGEIGSSLEYKLKQTNESTPQVVGGEYDNVAGIKTALEAAIKEIIENSENANCEVKLTPLYQTAYKESFTVTVVNGTITNNSNTSIQLNAETAVTVQANAPEAGKKFECWKVVSSDEATDGTPVSYNEVYSFYASKTIIVKAFYVDDQTAVEAKATTDMIKFAVIDSTDTKNKFSFTSTATVPEGCTIEKAGLRFWRLTEDGDVSSLTPTLEKGLSSTTTTYNYTLNISMTKGKQYVLYLQSFVTYLDTKGERITVDGKYYKVTVTGSESVSELQAEEVTSVGVE